jgi:hypothetical protein
MRADEANAEGLDSRLLWLNEQALMLKQLRRSVSGPRDSHLRGRYIASAQLADIDGIEERMHRTTVTIDLAELRKAEGNLGTHGIKQTINRALVEVNRRIALERAAKYVESGRPSVPDWDAFVAWRKRAP